MISSIKSILVATCSTAIFIGAAAAADLDRPIYQDQRPNVQPVEIGNSWYLRGDIAYNFDASNNNIGSGSTFPGSENDYRDRVSYGGGVGYQINDVFRVDATAERMFSSEFRETTGIAVPSNNICVGTASVTLADGTTASQSRLYDCYNEDNVSYNAVALMANAYVDLGTIAGFTPYLGLGVGVGRVRWREETGRIHCFPGIVALEDRYCGGGTIEGDDPINAYAVSPGEINEGSDFRLAYSAMAGVAYQATKNLKFDLGYKYTSVGSNEGIEYGGANTGSDLAKNGFAMHQVRAGFRYSLW